MVKHNIETDVGTISCIGQINIPTINVVCSATKIKSNIKETHLYKDSNEYNEYLELSSNDESSFTIEDYTYPINFKLCS